MSTLAIDGSKRLGQGGRFESIVRFADLLVLALAAPVFALAGLPLLGYAVAAGAWLAASAMQLAAERHVRRSIAVGNRRSAVGVLALATLGRVWLVALAVLLVGLAQRDAGLAAAVLAGVLVTFHLGGVALARLLWPESER